MSKSIFSAPQFNDEAAAYVFVEAHLWAKGRVGQDKLRLLLALLERAFE